MSLDKPSLRPASPFFSSGPCAKPPGWSAAALQGALTGRSHRSVEGKARLSDIILRTRRLLELPDDYRLAIAPGSDTGAFEMCLWSMLGMRGVEVLAWESFGKHWLFDVVDEMRLRDVIVRDEVYGALPDLSGVDFDRDVIFTANGTTSGVRVPNYDWIADERQGLTFADATSAVFSERIPWDKVDVLTFSWQKALGGEAQHGMIVLSPRAVERLKTYRPPRPVPKLFRFSAHGKFDEALFQGFTINTPSMLAVEDFAFALTWAEAIGGLDALIRRTAENAGVVYSWIERTPWVRTVARDRANRSRTSICFGLADPEIAARPERERRAFAVAMADCLAAEGVAFDIAAHRDAPPGLRLWTGPTVEAADLTALMPWLDWAYLKVKSGV